MSVLSFPDVIVFLFILIKGTFAELRYILIDVLKYFGYIVPRSDKNYSHVKMDNSNNGICQTSQIYEELEINQELVNVYVSMICHIFSKLEQIQSNPLVPK